MLHRYAQEKNGELRLRFHWRGCCIKKDFIVPIPGMRREERIIENLGAAEVSLTHEEFDSLERELGKITLHGNRTDKDIERLGTVKAQSFF